MTVFADASAVVTLYADEPGRNDLTAKQVVVIAALTRVEVPAALWRKHRMGELTASEAQTLTQGFEADYYGSDDGEPPRFVTLATSEEILDRAAAIAATHGLRAYDSVQLSSALVARDTDGDCSDFAAYDEHLRRAAATEGFRLVPAT